jgi:hypothetical protein
MSLKKTFNILISLSFGLVIFESFRYYRSLIGITCIGLQAPPENYALLKLFPFTGVLLLLPILLVIIRNFITKRSK